MGSLSIWHWLIVLVLGLVFLVARAAARSAGSRTEVRITRNPAPKQAEPASSEREILHEYAQKVLDARIEKAERDGDHARVADLKVRKADDEYRYKKAVLDNTEYTFEENF